MITEKDYNILADLSYLVDGAKAKADGINPVKKGTKLENKTFSQNYEVIEVKDNKENGMQAIK